MPHPLRPIGGVGRGRSAMRMQETRSLHRPVPQTEILGVFTLLGSFRAFCKLYPSRRRSVRRQLRQVQTVCTVEQAYGSHDAQDREDMKESADVLPTRRACGRPKGYKVRCPLSWFQDEIMSSSCLVPASRNGQMNVRTPLALVAAPVSPECGLRGVGDWTGQ